MDKIYIHYGSADYEPNLVSVPQHAINGKPDRGLWASPLDSEYGWVDWCKDEGYDPGWVSHNNSFFTFSLMPDSQILDVFGPEDVKSFIVRTPNGWWDFNWEYIMSIYSGMELHYSNYNGDVRFGYDTRMLFNGWDCDSIVIWNPDIIIPKSSYVDSSIVM